LFTTNSATSSSDIKGSGEKSILLFPNPVTNQELNILLPEEGQNIRLSVYNLNGQLVLKNFVSSYSKLVSLSNMNLNTGMYHLSLDTSNKIYNMKFEVFRR
jgi:hypothetical protein